MTRILVGEQASRPRGKTSLVIRVGAISAASARARQEAAVAVSIADPRRAHAMTRAIAGALRKAATSSETARANANPSPYVHLRTRKRLERLGPDRVEGAIVIMRVTEKNARRLPDLVDAVRNAGAAGVQLVWNGRDPERTCVERHVFEALERARATPSRSPVVLATSEEPAEALRILVSSRQPKDKRS